MRKMSKPSGLALRRGRRFRPSESKDTEECCAFLQEQNRWRWGQFGRTSSLGRFPRSAGKVQGICPGGRFPALPGSPNAQVVHDETADLALIVRSEGGPNDFPQVEELPNPLADIDVIRDAVGRAFSPLLESLPAHQQRPDITSRPAAIARRGGGTDGARFIGFGQKEVTHRRRS
jgi:hypothetical protein